MGSIKLPYWLAAEESKLIYFRDLAHLMAKSLHPSDAEEMSYAAARINLDAELPEAVQNGALIVRNPAGLGRLTLPIGDALKNAAILLKDLQPFLELRGIELRLMPHGSGPLYWTLVNASAAIATQENWHNGARASLLDDMKLAADKRELKVRDPHTDLYKTSGEVRTFWELVTPSDVNIWLENRGAPYRWNAPASSDAEVKSHKRDCQPDSVFAPNVEENVKSSVVVVPSDRVQVHKIQNRARQLNAEIKCAQQNAADPNDFHSVWTELTKLALDEFGAFNGVRDKKGLQYTYSDKEVRVFSKSALRGRMRRSDVNSR